MADLPAGLDALGPVHDHRVGDATLPRVTLEHLARRVEREGPAGRVVVVGLGRAEHVEVLEVVLEVVRNAVHDLVLVHRPVRAALARGAVVREPDDEGVVELTCALEVVDQPAELVIGVARVARVDLGHPAHQRLLVVGERVPWQHAVERGLFLAVDASHSGQRVDLGQLRVLREDPELLLLRQDLLADLLVALVEGALVLVRPLLRRVVRRMIRAGAEVHEERLVGSDLLRVGDHADRPVDEIPRQVVLVTEALRPLLAVLRRVGRLLDELLVLDEIGVPVARLAAQVSVVALEAAPGRPVPLRRCHVRLVLADDVPLSERVRVVALLSEHLGDRRRLGGNVPVRAGEPRGRLGDACHPDRRVVAAGQQRRSRRRADRRRVELGVAKPVVDEPLQRRHLDRTAERRQGADPRVVPHDEQHVRRALRCLRLHVRIPVGNRVADVQADDAVEALTHLEPPSMLTSVSACGWSASGAPSFCLGSGVVACFPRLRARDMSSPDPETAR